MIKKFELDTFPVTLYLFKPCESEVAAAYARKKYGVETKEMFLYDGYSFTLTRRDTGYRGFYLWLRDWDAKDGYWPSTLAHELGHVIDNIKEYLNIQEPEVGREVSAYLMSCLYGKCFSQLEKWKRKRRR